MRSFLCQLGAADTTGGEELKMKFKKCAVRNKKALASRGRGRKNV